MSNKLSNLKRTSSNCDMNVKKSKYDNFKENCNPKFEHMEMDNSKSLYCGESEREVIISQETKGQIFAKEKNEHPFTFKDIGLNSISGILSDPHMQAKKGPQVLKGMDNLPQVPNTLIRKVKPAEFDPYLKSLAEVFDRFQYNQAMGVNVATEGTPLLGNDANNDAPLSALKTLIEKISGSPSLDSKRNRNKNKKAHNRMFSGNAPNIKSVPQIFFDTDFNLCNPHTFQTVCENFDITALDDENLLPDFVENNNVLQDKLGVYLDTVEIHLIREISRRSNSFFAALSNLQALHQETQNCVIQINELRRKLNTVSKSVVWNGLNIVQLKRRRGNLITLYGGVKLVSEITQTQPMIQGLLSQADFIGSLDLIGETTLLLRGADDKQLNQTVKTEMLTNNIKLIQYPTILPRSLDLRRVKSLLNLNEKMHEMMTLISDMMLKEFVNVIVPEIKSTPVLIPDFRHIPVQNRLNIELPLPTTPAASWTNNILSGKFSFSVLSQTQSNNINPLTALTNVDGVEFKAGDEKLKARLVPLVVGLLRMDKLTLAFNAYKEALLSLIKSFSKKYYPQMLKEDDELAQNSNSPAANSNLSKKREEKQSALAKHLRSLSFESFADLLVMIYITLLYTLQKISIVHSVIKEILDEAKERGIVVGAEDMKFFESNTTEEKTVPKPLSFLAQKLNEDDDDDFGSFDHLNMSMDARREDKLSTYERNTRGSSTFQEMIDDSADIVYSASDLAHMRCAKLIGVRSEQNAQLNPKEFYRLFGATWEFVNAGESLSGRMCFGLKSTILSQAKSFVNFFHEEKSKQLALLIENEQWSQAEVPVDFQMITEKILLSSTSNTALSPTSPNPEIINSITSLDSFHQSEENLDGSETDLTNLSSSFSSTKKNKLNKFNMSENYSEGGNSGSASLKYLLVDGQKFYAVGCLLMFLKMLTDYMQCIDNIPGLTNDVLNRILEVLKLFNSRICQVILGAGALRSAGLKNITARHIALATQSLGVIVYIIPHLKTALSLRLPPKQQVLLTDFDRLLRDYREHQNELYFKLVSIMQERLQVHSKNMLAINWDFPDSKDFEENCSVAMSNLVKETCTLHKVLAKYLNTETLKKIMSEVFKAYSIKLEEDLKRLDLFSSGGKNKLLIDVQYYIEKLSGLDLIDGPGNHMEVVVNNIKIKDKRMTQANVRSSGSMEFGGSSQSLNVPLANSNTVNMAKSNSQSSPSPERVNMPNFLNATSPANQNSFFETRKEEKGKRFSIAAFSKAFNSRTSTDNDGKN
ncbi:hypothetical protein HDU92_001697 [Lobulomyces angularis]|nr:hypothetical protein HDU92_001697 [Lobulomyces angularis]